MLNSSPKTTYRLIASTILLKRMTFVNRRNSLYSSKISSNFVSVALPYVWLLTSSVSSTTSKTCFELTSSVLSTTSKQCFDQPAASFLVCSLIFIEYWFYLHRCIRNIFEKFGANITKTLVNQGLFCLFNANCRD